MLKNPFIACTKIRHKLNLTASVRTIRGYTQKPGWSKVETKYCQIVSFANKVKRFMFCWFCKIFNETYDNVVPIDECSVVVRLAGYKNFRKSFSDIIRAVGGQIEKPKHSPIKIHLLGGISLISLTPIVLFKGRMFDYDFQ